MRVPQTTRAKVSRPRSSVPNRCARVGALRTCFQSVCIGSTPAIHGAPIAVATNRSTTAAPSTAAGRRRAWRHARTRRSGSVAGAWASTALAAVVLGLTRRAPDADAGIEERVGQVDRKSTRLNSSHANISYAVFCLKKKKKQKNTKRKRTKIYKSRKKTSKNGLQYNGMCVNN